MFQVADLCTSMMQPSSYPERAADDAAKAAGGSICIVICSPLLVWKAAFPHHTHRSCCGMLMGAFRALATTCRRREPRFKRWRNSDHGEPLQYIVMDASWQVGTSAPALGCMWPAWLGNHACRR